MCWGWGVMVPATPSKRDFDNIRHHYDVGPETDHERFGIWAEVLGENSDLKGFGVQVTRTLRVEGATDEWHSPAEDFITDQVLIETMVQGTASNGPQPGMGTATWSGDLIAVDTTRFQPVLGAANLSMDLENIESLDASFTGLHRTDDDGMTHNVPDLAYTLDKTGTTWVDPRGAVAGRLDDAAQNLMGAFGALRDR